MAQLRLTTRCSSGSTRQRYGEPVAEAATRRLRTDGPYDFFRTLAPVRRGGGDPCMRLAPDECWRATRTPDGPATVRLVHRRGEVEVQAWGQGAVWPLEHAPGLLGLQDAEDGFDPRPPPLRELARRFPGIRICRTRAVAEALAPTVCEQKVTGGDARRAWHWLV